LSTGAEPFAPRTCLLTGASGAFGRAFSQRCADRYNIAAIYNTTFPEFASTADEVFDPLEPHQRAVADASVHPIQADLSTAEGCAWAVEATMQRFGCIDLFVHAAVYPVWAPLLGSYDLLDTAEMQFAVNVLAPLRLSSYLAHTDWQHHVDDNVAHNRNVVSLSSTASIRKYPGQGQSVYAASKAAVNHLTAHLADELASIGVRVNAVAPDSFPDVVAIEDVVDAVVGFDRSSLTGQVLVLDATGKSWLSVPRQE